MPYVDTTVGLTSGPTLQASIGRPDGTASGTILFAHGSGSGRHSPRNRHVADILGRAGYETVLLDLLTEDEDEVDARTREHRFDIPLLANRVGGSIDWLDDHAEDHSPIGLFGASTGAAAALIAAADHPDRVSAVVSRGGRPDMAEESLAHVRAATLLIVGGNDPQVLDLNRAARERLTADSSLEIIAGATHLFEEPGALDQVADLTADWFHRHLDR